nr:HERV-H LTR-associating protein 2 isoform X2 [Nothobranchius furzeri]
MHVDSVSQQVSAVEMFQGDRFLLLPCEFHTFDLQNATVVWIRQDLTPSTVHQRQAEEDQLKDQNLLYRGRTSMKADALVSGDLSLNLTNLQLSDSGTYTCLVTDFSGELNRTHLDLKVKERFHSWTIAVHILLVAVVLVLLWRLLSHFQYRFVPGYRTDVEVESGAESVLLPCRSTVHLPEGAKVVWRDHNHYKVHVLRTGSDGAEEQLPFYKNRTTMNEELLRSGDFSLTLDHPTRADTDTYTCTVSTRRKKILMRRKVRLQVKVQQVEVESGAESVLLPCEISADLPEDTKVEWRDSDDWLVHGYWNRLDQFTEQYWFYRTRTRMNEDLLSTGDLSLTLQHPTYQDRNTFTCTVYSSQGTILMMKQVELQVKDYQVEVEEGAESVVLPFKTTPELLRDIRLMWWRFHPGPVLLMHEGSNQRQNHRIRMNEDRLRTGDLSLTLKNPTEKDYGSYRCGVWRRGTLLVWTTILLTAKGRVQVSPGSEDLWTRRSSIDMTPLISDQSD